MLMLMLRAPIQCLSISEYALSEIRFRLCPVIYRNTSKFFYDAPLPRIELGATG